MIFYGEEERAYQPRETKRILSPWLTPTINTGDPSRTLSFSALIFICRHRASISRLYDAHDDPSGSPLNGINTLKQKWVPRSFESTYPPTPGVDPSYPRTSFPSGFPIGLNLWSLWITWKGNNTNNGNGTKSCISFMEKLWNSKLEKKTLILFSRC